MPKIAIWVAKLANFSSSSSCYFPREEFPVSKFLVPHFSPRNALTTACANVSTIKRIGCVFGGNKWITFFTKMDADISNYYFFQKIYIFSILFNESFFRLPLPLHICVIAKFNDPRRDNRANATRELRGLSSCTLLEFIFEKYVSY